MFALPSPLLAQSSFNAEVNDVWATDSEPGWGLQIVEQGNIAFSTLFVNDAANRPTFLTAFLTESPPDVWTGDLIETHGPWFGSAVYDTQQFNARKAGVLKFTKTSSSTATLEYTVDGAAVTRQVTRQLWRYANYSGNYLATVYVVTTHCSDTGDDGERSAAYPVSIEQNGTAVKITGNFAKRGTSACTYLGDYTQAGRVGAVATSYTCSDGDEGAMAFFELSRRPGMFSGRLQGHSITDSCDYNGAITGLIPR
jgi:hypothetical protein